MAPALWERVKLAAGRRDQSTGEFAEAAFEMLLEATKEGQRTLRKSPAPQLQPMGRVPQKAEGKTFCSCGHRLNQHEKHGRQPCTVCACPTFTTP